MNVIIRLQNLPWSANASDIRSFFKGLMIPEGGVHIVGGENGDAFIAFSTDEDARQAMQLNGGKLKEIQVSLLLSSRAEMQKVIEKARQVPSTTFMNKLPTTQPSGVLSAAHIANTFGKKMSEQIPTSIIPSQSPAISLTNFLTKSMMQQSTQPINPQAQQLNYMAAYQTLPSNEIPGLGGMTSSSMPITSSLSSLPIGVPPNSAAAAAYAKYIATLSDPNLMTSFANPMSPSLTAHSQESLRNPPAAFHTDPRSGPRIVPRVDPRNQRSDSREQNDYRRQRSRSAERNPSKRSRSNSQENDRYNNGDRDGKEGGSKRRTRFSAAVTSDVPMNVGILTKPPSAAYSVPPPVVSSIWDKPPQVFGSEITPQLSLGSGVTYANFNNNGSSLNPPTRNYQTENSSSNNFSSSTSAASSSFGIGTCVKVSNVDSETFYSDLRKFFNGLPIGNNDIKFITDSKDNRTGVVLIRFLSSDSKKKALTKSMWQLKSTQVMITSITEEEFESGLMNVKKDARQSNYNNNRNDDRYDRNDRYRDRSDSRDRNFNNNNRNHNRNDGNYRNNRYDDRLQNNRDEGGNSRRNFRNEEPEKPKEYKPDEKYTVLIIDDIPRTASEPDILEAFPNILSLTIERYTAYAKFTSHDNAKVVLENRFIHYIQNKRVFLEAGSEAQFNDVAKKHGKHDNPDFKDSSENSNDNDDMKFKEDQDNDDTNRTSNSNSRDNFRNNDQNSHETRDPRQRNFNGDPRNNGPRNNDRFRDNNGQHGSMKTDCVIMKNMEPGTKIEDVEEFYKDIGIYKIRVHILLDKKGQPCGDCFVEFKYPQDSYRAISKNNKMLKDKRVQVMLIPREQVEAVLSSFGGDDTAKPMSNNRPNRADWAPPNDFGSPGCVLMLSNLCYRASIDDVLGEFREFDLTPDQIIRRFNDMGQPTGNACINFNSPEDADMALDKYNSIKIMNRPVWLKRV